MRGGSPDNDAATRPRPHARGGDVFDALADPTRRRIIEALAQRPGLTASALADEFPVTRQAIAKHLGILRDAGLADVVRAGREARYSFTPDPLGDAMAWMVSAGAALATRRTERNRP